MWFRVQVSGSKNPFSMAVTKLNKTTIYSVCLLHWKLIWAKLRSTHKKIENTRHSKRTKVNKHTRWHDTKLEQKKHPIVYYTHKKICQLSCLIVVLYLLRHALCHGNGSFISVLSPLTRAITSILNRTIEITLLITLNKLTFATQKVKTFKCHFAHLLAALFSLLLDKRLVLCNLPFRYGYFSMSTRVYLIELRPAHFASLEFVFFSGLTEYFMTCTWKMCEIVLKHERIWANVLLFDVNLCWINNNGQQMCTMFNESSEFTSFYHQRPMIIGYNHNNNKNMS